MYVLSHAAFIWFALGLVSQGMRSAIENRRKTFWSAKLPKAFFDELEDLKKTLNGTSYANFLSSEGHKSVFFDGWKKN